MATSKFILGRTFESSQRCYLHRLRTVHTILMPPITHVNIGWLWAQFACICDESTELIVDPRLLFFQSSFDLCRRQSDIDALSADWTRSSCCLSVRWQIIHIQLRHVLLVILSNCCLLNVTHCFPAILITQATLPKRDSNMWSTRVVPKVSGLIYKETQHNNSN